MADRMKAVIAGALLLPPGDERGREYRQRLSLPSPAHIAWQKHGKGREPDPTVTCVARQDGGPWEGGAIVPRYAPEAGGADRMVMPPEGERLHFRGEMRAYQTAAVNAVLDTELDSRRRTGYGGIIQAPCGAGKTSMGCRLMADIPTPAIVLVHTKDLADQWVERVRSFLGVEAAVVGYGKGLDKLREARVTVGSLQTLARSSWWDLHQAGKRWGLCIVDEAHHAPAATMAQVIAAMSGRWRVGLTATPKRADGLTPWLHWICGPTVAAIAPSVLERAGNVLAPQIVRRDVHDIALDGLEAHERDRRLAEDARRNHIVATAARDAVAEGRRVLCLVKLVDHAHALAELMRSHGLRAEALVGELPKAEREGTIDAMRSGDVEVVVATSLADEGLDAPRLDTAILVHPSGNLGRVEQRIGRVCRPHPAAKPPRVIDLVDTWGPMQGYARRRWGLYRSRGWV